MSSESRQLADKSPATRPSSSLFSKSKYSRPITPDLTSTFIRKNVIKSETNIDDSKKETVYSQNKEKITHSCDIDADTKISTSSSKKKANLELEINTTSVSNINIPRIKLKQSVTKILLKFDLLILYSFD